MQIISDNLSFVYSEKNKNLAVKALDGVSVNIAEGEFFGIIGKTGSGKSTFIQHLNGLIKVQKDRGSLIVGNFNLADKKCDFKGLRAKLGMVFQYPEHQLFAETVSEDVAFGIKNFMGEVSPEQTEEMVKQAVELVGLDYEKVKDKSPFELSGGQKRRVAIAGVIVTKPEVLVLDEPAAGLDPKGKREFIALLKKLHGDTIKTVIIVSHDMNLISENCTKAVIFKNGKILEDGSPKEIFSSAEKIKKAGLELPVTAYLTQQLKGVGIEIDNDLTEEGFINAFCDYYFSKNHAKNGAISDANNNAETVAKNNAETVAENNQKTKLNNGGKGL